MDVDISLVLSKICLSVSASVPVIVLYVGVNFIVLPGLKVRYGGAKGMDISIVIILFALCDFNFYFIKSIRFKNAGEKSMSVCQICLEDVDNYLVHEKYGSLYKIADTEGMEALTLADCRIIYGPCCHKDNCLSYTALYLSNQKVEVING